MKPKFVSKLQALGRQVEPIREFIQAAPAEAARLREAVVLTASQLQKLRSEIQVGLADLRADSGSVVLAALEEIRGTREILRQAGFVVAGVDLEMAMTTGQRLMIQLRRVEAVPTPMLRALATANPGRLVLRAVLGALERATELAGTVDLPELEFALLTVTVGPVPGVRIGWCPPGEVALPSSTDTQPAAVKPALGSGLSAPLLAPPVIGSVAPPLMSTEGQAQTQPQTQTPTRSSTTVTGGSAWASSTTSGSVESVLPLSSPVAAPKPAAYSGSSSELPAVATPASSVGLVTGAKTLAPDWREKALDRFKKMPGKGPSGA